MQVRVRNQTLAWNASVCPACKCMHESKGVSEHNRVCVPRVARSMIRITANYALNAANMDNVSCDPPPTPCTSPLSPLPPRLVTSASELQGDLRAGSLLQRFLGSCAEAIVLETAKGRADASVHSTVRIGEEHSFCNSVQSRHSGLQSCHSALQSCHCSLVILASLQSRQWALTV